jgi:hypothetical protein
MDEVTTQELVKLIRDIMESIDNTQTGNPIHVTQLGDEILMVEFGEQRFRIMVQDTRKFM